MTLVERFQIAYQYAARLGIGFLLLLLGRLRVEGREHFPQDESFIVVTNHLSKIDTGIVLLVMPLKVVRVFAADKWRTNALFGPLLALSGAIFVKRGEVDRRALRAALDALGRGQILGMAPEGTRSRTKNLQPARQGAAYLASRAGVAIVPLGIQNTDRFDPNIRRLKRTDFCVRVGCPFRLPPLGHRPTSKDLGAYSELIMAQIANLLPERYHGVYAASPALQALQAGNDPWLAIQNRSRDPAPPERACT